MTADIQRRLALAAAAGVIGCAIALWLNPRTMLASYLAAWFAVSAVPIGALGVLFTSYLVRAGWTSDLQPPLSNAALTMPFVAALFVPVLIGVGIVYPWASDAAALPAFKAAYLTPWFFVLRSVIYFAIWTALGVWASRAYGRDAMMVRAASAGLIVWTLTTSWAGIDWLESVEPQFHSSIYGLLTVSSVLLGALAFGIAAVLAAPRPRRMSNASYSATLLSVLLLWAYLHAMQYIIIWTGNIPEEVIWYLVRLDGGWGVALWLMFIGQFVVPFFALLSARVRSSTAALLWLAGGTLALRFLEAAVLVLPPLHVANWTLLLALPAAILAVGAAWGLAFTAMPALLARWSDRAAAIG